ncbi:MAG: efflux RND transporter periplasmic adaptor subunit [Pseudomonadota bacterium]
MSSKPVWMGLVLFLGWPSIVLGQVGSAQKPHVLYAEVASVVLETGDRFTGAVVATDRLALVPRVSGTIASRVAQEGATVAAGDPILKLDTARFEARVSEAKADLAAAQAVADDAKEVFTREEELAKSNTVARAKLDDAKSALAQAEAQVLVRKSAVRLAELDLADTTLNAPFSGMLGPWTQPVGALAGPSSSPVVTLVALDPIRVRFPVRQRQLLAARERYGSKIRDLEIAIILADGSTYSHPGKIRFAEAVADPLTDAIFVLAEVPNPEHLLRDGQRVGVLAREKNPAATLAIPQSALMIDADGAHVLTLDADGKVGRADVTTGIRAKGLVAVSKGLAEGGRVITEGQLKVQVGMSVDASPAKASDG